MGLCRGNSGSRVPSTLSGRATSVSTRRKLLDGITRPDSARRVSARRISTRQIQTGQIQTSRIKIHNQTTIPHLTGYSLDDSQHATIAPPNYLTKLTRLAGHGLAHRRAG